VPAVADQVECSREDALRRVGVSERQLRSWEKQELIRPAARYGIDELKALRTLAKLREARVPPAKIRRAVDAVRRRLRDVSDPLAELRVYSDGRRLRVQVGGVGMEPESGQLLLDLDGAEIRRLVSLPSRRREDHGAALKRKQREAEIWFQKGVDLEQANASPEQAIEAYRIAIDLDPQLAAALVNLGTIYFTARDWEKAERYYRRAIEANPTYPLAHFNMGNLFDERGDRINAHRHYQTAIQLEPGYADAHYNLALLFQSSGQVMKAVQHWRSYLKLDPVGTWAEIARRELDKLYAATVVRGEGGKPRVHPAT
jgi:tetratricopeptide (TPR) repeat protein